METINGKLASHMPCCGIAAVAAIVQLPIEEVFKTAKALLGREGNWKGRTHQAERLKLLGHYGVTYEPAHCRTPVGGQMTLKRWIGWYAKPNTTYLMSVTGHSFMLRNGIMTDQSGQIDALVRIRYRRKRVREAFAIAQ